MIVHISSIHQAERWSAEISNSAYELAKAFWPGPMTLILPRSKLAKNFITGAQNTVGLRIPKNDIALKLLYEFEELGGLGIAAPSANKFGAISPTSANDVKCDIGHLLSQGDLILEGGNCEIGIESTIIDCTGTFPTILRPGSITGEMIEQVTKLGKLKKISNGMPRVSGSFNSHYLPKTQVLTHGKPNKGDGFLALAQIPTPKDAIRLASPETEIEFAQILYSSLRLADAKKIKKVFVVVPTIGHYSAAIKDRVSKMTRR